DSGKFAGINPKGVELVHRWNAEPIKFEISGDERTDPNEIIDLIAQKSGLKFLKYDIVSPDYERRERAEQALFQYADTRLKNEKSVPGRFQQMPDYLRE